MAELDKQVTLNAFHIFMVAFVLNLLINGNNDYIINFINYLINVETPGFWFIMLHIGLLYIILSNLKLEFGFRAAIKFNL